MHLDDTACEWGVSPLTRGMDGKWARPTCQDGIESAQSTSSSLQQLVEVGDEKVG